MVLINCTFPQSTSINYIDFSNIQKIAKKVTASVEKVWSYAGKSLLASRHLLNAVLKNVRFKDIELIKLTILRLKYFPVISISLNFIALPALVDKLWKNIRWADFEGITLSLSSLSILTLDTLDSAATFINALIQTVSQTPIGWISDLGLPLGFAITGIGSVSRTYRLIRLSLLKNELKTHITDTVKSGNLSSKKYLEEKLNNEKTLRTLERSSNNQVVSQLKSIQSFLKDHDSLTEEQIHSLSKSMDQVMQLLNEQWYIEAAYLLTNVVTATALILFALSNPTAIPFLLLATAVVSRIGIQAYQDRLSNVAQ